jgi:hypothetical protein
MEPSRPPGDAPCPSCGTLLWFTSTTVPPSIAPALGAADVEPKGKLLVLGSGDSIPLRRPHLTVGRRETCDVCLGFSNVSAIHCVLEFERGYWYIRDRNSTNGVKVNGVRVYEKVLHPGDTITIGKRAYTIEYTPPAGSQPSS